MSKEMNRLLWHTIKYDLESGILMSLLIGLSSSFFSAMIYFLGIVMGMLNFICSCYVTEKFLFKEGFNSLIALFLTIFRIICVIAAAIPLIHNLKLIALYLAGFISHLIVLSISGIIKNK